MNRSVIDNDYSHHFPRRLFPLSWFLFIYLFVFWGVPHWGLNSGPHAYFFPYQRCSRIHFLTSLLKMAISDLQGIWPHLTLFSCELLSWLCSWSYLLWPLRKSMLVERSPKHIYGMDGEKMPTSFSLCNCDLYLGIPSFCSHSFAAFPTFHSLF
jgi:hypothetical protein